MADVHRLKCEVCEQKSEPVGDPYNMTFDERIMLAAFKGIHDKCLARLQAAPTCGPFGSAKAAPKHVRRPHGHFEITGPYGEIQEGETLSCCHCGKHWEVRAGSGAERGFCQNCMGYVCGPTCYDCVPAEQKLLNMEAGVPLLTPRAPSILVPASELFLPEYSDVPQ